MTIIGPNYIIYVGEYNVQRFLMTLLDGSDEEGTNGNNISKLEESFGDRLSMVKL